MDWSLLLASQGIESRIDHQPEQDRWRLLIPASDLERSWAAIRQYCRENRGWPWHYNLTWSRMTFHWGILPWVWLIVLIHMVSAAPDADLRVAGIMDSEAVRGGEWWRLVTAIWLHADPGHLASNAVTGFLILGLAMARFGAGWTMLAVTIAGAIGNVAGLIFHTAPYHGLGASGMVLGGLGLLATHAAVHWRTSPAPWRTVAPSFIGAFLLFVLVGFSPNSDVVAHAGGFAGGAVLGSLLSLGPARREKPAYSLPAWLGFAVINLGCWILAIRTLVQG